MRCRVGRILAAVGCIVAIVAGCGHDENDPHKPVMITQLPAVTVIHGLTYESKPVTMKLDLYLPHPPAGKRSPLVIVIHGGGWTAGGRADPREVEICTTLADAGFAAASVSYHLGGSRESAWWPRNLIDCKTALRFLRANADQYNIDPKHVGVLGESAGAQLALMLAFTSDVPALEPTTMPGVSDKVDAVVEMYGDTNLLSRQGTKADGTPNGKFHDTNAARMLGYSLGLYPDLWKSASPVNYIRRDDPPVLIIHGLKDPTVDYPQASELYNDLKASGVDATLMLLKGVPHGFDLKTVDGKKPLPIDLRPPVVQFFRRTIAD
jgi:acetyl esterase/lipase